MSMDHPHHNMLAWIDKRLADLLAYPGQWGSPETIEMQMILLLEARFALLNPTGEREDEGHVFQMYQRLLRQHYPNDGNLPLHQIVKDVPGMRPLGAALDKIRALIVADMDSKKTSVSGIVLHLRVRSNPPGKKQKHTPLRRDKRAPNADRTAAG
jgi:hypothetical protein